jgi:hypothetical protein
MVTIVEGGGRIMIKWKKLLVISNPDANVVELWQAVKKAAWQTTE